MRVVAVTACVTGMAHTWIAQKVLIEKAAELGIELKVEVQSAMGVDDMLSQSDIDEADVVIFAADIIIKDRERFEGKKLFKVSPSEVVRHPESVLKQAEALGKNA